MSFAVFSVSPAAAPARSAVFPRPADEGLTSSGSAIWLSAAGWRVGRVTRRLFAAASTRCSSSGQFPVGRQSFLEDLRHALRRELEKRGNLRVFNPWTLAIFMTASSR